VSKSFNLSLTRAFLIAYTLGIIICLCCPVVLYFNIDKLITPISGISAETLQGVGYAFTGLILICILVVNSRWGKVRSKFSKNIKNKQGIILLFETVLYSIIFGLSSVFGTIYYLLGGASTKLLAGNFIVLTPIMFFIFVPRLHTWQRASNDNKKQ
jgi:hypothetical protein